VAAQLTTLELVKSQLGIPDAVTSFDDTLNRIVAATNLEIENFCNRHFTQQEYAETLNGTGDRIVQLRNHPVKNINYAAAGHQDVLTITYTGSLLGRVDVPRTDRNTPITSITLADDATSTDVAISATNTLIDLVGLINALADWTATVPSSLENYPARALTPIFKGNLIPNESTCLLMPTHPLTLRADNQARGDYMSSGFLPESVCYIVLYVGGYAEPYPADLVSGATDLAANTYRDNMRDGNLKSEKIGNYSWAKDISLYLDYMTHVIVLKRDKPGQDEYGGEGDQQDEFGTYLARPQNLSSTQTTYNAQNQALVFDKIFTTMDCPVKVLDTIELRSKVNNDLISTYEVRRVEMMQRTQTLHHLELDVREYQ
jgi:hypothetical protein